MKKTLRKKTENGSSVLFITHNMRYIDDCDYVYFMDKGEIVLEGEPHNVKNNKIYKEFSIEINKVNFKNNYNRNLKRN